MLPPLPPLLPGENTGNCLSGLGVIPDGALPNCYILGGKIRTLWNLGPSQSPLLFKSSEFWQPAADLGLSTQNGKSLKLIIVSRICIALGLCVPCHSSQL